jgi:hypothetical protein
MIRDEDAMSDATPTDPTADAVADTATAPDNTLRRRTIIGAAVWAAPAVAATVATPAYAVSMGDMTLSLIAPGTAEVGTLGSDAVYATVLIGGEPAAGTAVTFVVADAALGGFGAGAERSVTVVTDGAGIARPPAMVLKAAGSVELSATTNGRTEVAVIVASVVTSRGSIAFTQPTLSVAARSVFALAGKLTRTSGAGYPAEVSIEYSSGYSGPASAPVDPATGEFVISGVVAGAASGSITASAVGYGAATAAITPVNGYISTSQALYAAGKGLAAPYGTYAITGTVGLVASDAVLPATVTIAWAIKAGNNKNATGFADGQSVDVDPVTGGFALPILTPTSTGATQAAQAPGTLRISAPGYQPIDLLLYNVGSTATASEWNGASTTPAVIAFRPGEVRDISGLSLMPSSLNATNYPTGFSGPEKVRTLSSGAYTIGGVKAPDYVTSGQFLLQESKGASGYWSRGVFVVF